MSVRIQIELLTFAAIVLSPTANESNAWIELAVHTKNDYERITCKRHVDLR